jgi:hypothetical protein
MAVARLEPKYRMAGARVAGLLVLGRVPDTASIRASLLKYKVLPGIRSVPFSAFFPAPYPKPKYYSVSEERRTLSLARQIASSRELEPLIVVEDRDGPYVLEGSHRFDALLELGVKRFPALVVIDLDAETGVG